MFNLSEEIEIVWLEDPLKYSYLREMHSLTSAPKGLKKDLAKQGMILIGYSVSKRPNKEGRIWFFNDYDTDLEPDKQIPYRAYPNEAVEPTSIKAREKSKEKIWTPSPNYQCSGPGHECNSKQCPGGPCPEI